MSRTEISASILGYENDLAAHEGHIQDSESYKRIKEIINAGIDHLHIDIIRPLFISETASKKRFSVVLIEELFSHFGDKVRFDLHLMVDSPFLFVEMLGKIPKERKQGLVVSCHAESYREIDNITFKYNDEICAAAAKFVPKEYDLISVTKNNDMLERAFESTDKYKKNNFLYLREQKERRIMLLQQALVEMDYHSKKKVAALLNYINVEYFSCVALEPETSLENILNPVTPPLRLGEDTKTFKSIINYTNIVLLMGVCSGRGGQPYMQEVNKKISALHEAYPNLMVQVDGGINEETIEGVLKAGANNLVIGSYITGNKNPGKAVEDILKDINDYTK